MCLIASLYNPPNNPHHPLQRKEQMAQPSNAAGQCAQALLFVQICHYYYPCLPLKMLIKTYYSYEEYLTRISTHYTHTPFPSQGGIHKKQERH